MRKLQRCASTVHVRVLIAATALLAVAATASANFNITLSPNPLQVQAGKSAGVMIATQNLGLPPEAASIEYSIMSIHPAGGGAEVPVRTTAMPSMGPAFSPVTLQIPVAAGSAPGAYAGSIVGVVKNAKGGVVGPKQFVDVLHVTVQGSAPAPSKRTTSLSVSNATAACSATAVPTEITLTNDFKAGVVVVRTNAGCSTPEITYSFGTVDNITTDMSNCSVQRQADGSYPEAKFMVRAGPSVPAKTWEMPFIHGYADKTLKTEVISPPLTMKITVVGAGQPAGTPTPAGPNFSVAFAPPYTEDPAGNAAFPLQQGQNIQVTATITASGGFQGAVQFTNARNPNALDVTPDTITVNVGPSGTAAQMFTVTAKPTAPLGSAFFSFHATAGAISKAAALFPNIIAAGPATPPGPLPVSFPAPSGILKNRASSKCMTIDTTGGRQSGVHMIMQDCRAGDANQLFTFGAHGEVMNQPDCAVLYNSSTEDNTAIVLWHCNGQGQANEEWTYDSSNRLIGRTHKKCMEPGSAAANDLILRPCTDGANQKWDVAQQEAGPLPVSFPAQSGILKNRGSSKCMTANASGGLRDGSHFIMQDCAAGNANQLFSFGPHGEVMNQSRCAVLDNSSTNDNTAILAWTCNGQGQPNEEWTFDSSNHLIGRTHKKCMEPGSTTTNDLILRPCADSANQKWDVAQQQVVAPPPARLARNFPAQQGILRNQRAATCLTAEKAGTSDGTRLILSDCVSSAAQIFTFGPNGEIQIGNKCAVLNNNQSADDTPVVLWTCSNNGQDNEIWTMDSSNRLIGRVQQKCISPNANDPAQAMVFEPCWTEKARMDNQQWTVEQPPVQAPVQAPVRGAGGVQFDDLIISLNTGGQITPPLTIDAGKTTRLSFYAKPQGATKTSTVDVTLSVTVAVEGAGLAVQPSEFPLRLERLLPAGNGPCCSIKAGSEPVIDVIAGNDAGQATLRVTAVAADGTTRTQTLPVVIRPNMVKGQWVVTAPPPGIAGDEATPQKQGGGTGTVPTYPETLQGVDAFSQSLAEAEKLAAQYEGIGEAASALGPEFLEQEQLDTIVGLSELQTALLAQLHSGVPLDLQDAALRKSPARSRPDASDIDAEIVRLFISGGLRRMTRAAKPYQVASIAGIPLLFGMDFASMAENKDMFEDIKAGRVDWRELTRQREPIEILLDMMQSANQNDRAITPLQITDGVLKDMDKRLSDTRLDKVPFKQWQFALKALSITGTTVAVLRLATEAYPKLMPSRIADLYANVGGYSKLPDAPAPKIAEGGKSSLKVYMTAKSLGGPVITPSDIADLIAKPLWEKFKAKVKMPAARQKKNKPSPAKAGAPGESGKGVDAENGDDAGPEEPAVPLFTSQEQLKDFILDEMMKKIVAIPKLRAWAQKLNQPLTVASYKKGPFLVNSERVLSLKYNDGADQLDEGSRSKQLIRLGDSSPGHYYIEGLKSTEAGKTAGYSYALNHWLIDKLGNATQGISCVRPSDASVPPQCGLFRKGVVEVVKAERTCSLGTVGSECAMPGDKVTDIAFGVAYHGVISSNCECVHK